MKINENSLLKLFEGLQIKENKELTVSWDGVPEIPFTSLSWGKENIEDPRLALDGKIVRQYFRNIGGDTFYEKMNTIQSTLSLEQVGQVSIQDALGRLLAVKTIISNITDFNEDSAGKNFEVIFAALMNGNQVTGQDSEQTADVIVGDKLYGLKLITGKTSGNSFTTLVNSVFAANKEITYILGIKKGSSDSITLQFYEGLITVDNVFDLFTSQPLKVADDYYGASLIKEEDDKQINNLPPELQELFSSPVFAGSIPLPAKDANGDYSDPEDFFDSPMGRNIKEKRLHPAFILNAIHEKLFGLGIPGFRPDDRSLFVAKSFYRNPKLDSRQKKVVDLFNNYREFISKLNRGETDSSRSDLFDPNKNIKIEAYKVLPLEKKIEVLKNTVQYTTNQKFYVTSTNSKIFSRVGRTFVASKEELDNLYKSLKSSIDEKITEIFVQMKSLSDNINLYFLDGMQDDQKAKNAIEATDKISKNTTKLRSERGYLK